MKLVVCIVWNHVLKTVYFAKHENIWQENYCDADYAFKKHPNANDNCLS